MQAAPPMQASPSGLSQTCKKLVAIPTQKLNPVPKKGVAMRTPTSCEMVSPLTESWSSGDVDATVACSAAAGSDCPTTCCFPVRSMS